MGDVLPFNKIFVKEKPKIEEKVQLSQFGIPFVWQME